MNKSIFKINDKLYVFNNDLIQFDTYKIIDIRNNHYILESVDTNENKRISWPIDKQDRLLLVPKFKANQYIVDSTKHVYHIDRFVEPCFDFYEVTCVKTNQKFKIPLTDQDKYRNYNEVFFSAGDKIQTGCCICLIERVDFNNERYITKELYPNYNGTYDGTGIRYISFKNQALWKYCYTSVFKVNDFVFYCDGIHKIKDIVKHETKFKDDTIINYRYLIGKDCYGDDVWVDENEITRATQDDIDAFFKH